MFYNFFRNLLPQQYSDIMDIFRVFRIYADNSYSNYQGASHIRQLLTWHMRMFVPNNEYGIERTKEKYAEIERFQYGLGYPDSLDSFMNLVDELLSSVMRASKSGLVSFQIKDGAKTFFIDADGNMNEKLDPHTGLGGCSDFPNPSPEDGYDESVLIDKALDYIINVCQLADEHPILWYLTLWEPQRKRLRPNY